MKVTSYQMPESTWKLARTLSKDEASHLASSPLHAILRYSDTSWLFSITLMPLLSVLS